MSFQFNMQKILDYRELMEEEARGKLAKAENDLRKGREKLGELKKELERARAEVSGKLLQSEERWLQDQYEKGLAEDIRQAEMNALILAQLVEEARKILAARALDRKVLEKLKERQKIQFLRAEQKQEQNFNDEIATIRFKASALQTGQMSSGARVS